MEPELRRKGALVISLLVAGCCTGVAHAGLERYAVNLTSTRRVSDLTRLASHPTLERHRLYMTRFEKDGAVWNRWRLGFFETQDEALAAAASLKKRFPDAWVTRVSDGEWRRFGRDDRVAFEPVATTQASNGGEPPRAAPIDEARAALRSGDHGRALSLVEPLLTSTDPALRADALEISAISLERGGDRGGAVAAFAHYLDEYADREGAERVRQRLTALQTAGAPPIPTLRSADAADAGGWEVDSEVEQWYLRAEDASGAEGRRVTGSLLSNGLDLRARRETRNSDTTLRLEGAYVGDFDERASGALQARELYVDFEERRLHFSARVGRQRRGRDGVLGRFDGGTVGYRLNQVLKLNAVGGLPVDHVDDRPDGDRYFYGLSLDIGPFDNGWDFNLYGIDQQVDGIVDRTALGGELRYADVDRSLYGLVDYDISYKALNTLLLLGTWAFAERTAIDLTLEYQRTPILTTSNALIGQPAGSIDELLATLDEAQVRRLARDRTALSRSVRVGGSYPLGERFRLHGDFSYSHLSNDETDRELEGTDGTGGQFRYNAQLIGQGLLRHSDLHVFSLGFLQARRGDVVSLGLDAAYPLDSAWFIKPRMLLGYRNGKDGDGSHVTVGFTPRLDYLLRDNLRLHLEVGGEWASGRITGESADAYGYFLEAGYRWEF